MREISLPAKEPFAYQEKALLNGVMYLYDIYIYIYIYIVLSIKVEKQLKLSLQMYVFIGFRIKIMCLKLPYNEFIFKMYILTF